MSEQLFFNLVLHTNIPYVLSHGTWPDGIDWLNEITAETYIPLLNVFNRLSGEGIPPKVTISFAPVVLEMLSSETFKDQFVPYLEYKIDCAEKDISMFEKLGNGHLAGMARMWKEFYFLVLQDFSERYHSNLVRAFRKLNEEGNIEIITSSATHAYLPLLSKDGSIAAQIKQGVATYKRHFEKAPAGIWLPECAYMHYGLWQKPFVGGSIGEAKPYLRKGIEGFLADSDITYFYIDSSLPGYASRDYIDRFDALGNIWNMKEHHEAYDRSNRTQILGGAYYVNNSPANIDGGTVFLLVRDAQSEERICSLHCGYPANSNYLESRKKSFPSGFKYWRITNKKEDLASKEEYNLDGAYLTISDNASDFCEFIKGRFDSIRKENNNCNIIVSAHDAGLFGQRWFEGPEWLYHTIKSLNTHDEINMVTSGEYLANNKPSEEISIDRNDAKEERSWIWLNSITEWIWKRIYKAEETVTELIDENREVESPLFHDIVEQICRELLLMQSSEWQLLITTFSAKEYAEMRTVEHINNIEGLVKLAKHVAKDGSLRKKDWALLHRCKEENDLFDEINPEWFCDVPL